MQSAVSCIRNGRQSYGLKVLTLRLKYRKTQLAIRPKDRNIGVLVHHEVGES